MAVLGRAKKLKPGRIAVRPYRTGVNQSDGSKYTNSEAVLGRIETGLVVTARLMQYLAELYQNLVEPTHDRDKTLQIFHCVTIRKQYLAVIARICQ